MSDLRGCLKRSGAFCCLASVPVKSAKLQDWKDNSSATRCGAEKTRLSMVDFVMIGLVRLGTWSVMPIKFNSVFDIQVHGMRALSDNSLKGGRFYATQANNKMKTLSSQMPPMMGHSEGVTCGPLPQTPGAGFENDTAGSMFGRVAHPGGPWPPPGCTDGGSHLVRHHPHPRDPAQHECMP